jgi:hypothetical protein
MQSRHFHALTSRHPARLAMFEMPISWMPDTGSHHLKMRRQTEQQRDGVVPEECEVEASTDDRKHGR